MIAWLIISFTCFESAIYSISKEISTLGVLNNEATIDKNKRIGDSIDLAFLVLGKKEKVDISNIKIIDNIPYESENKYSAVFYEKDGEAYCTVKGSLEKVNSFCTSINLKNDADLEEQNESLASRGYRVIAIANGKVEKKSNYKESDIKDLTFMGMVGFIDPIRKEVVASISECKSAGIKVLMITGDHPLTAFSISKELGLTERRERFAHLRGLGKSVKEAGEIIGVSITTAKRYEQWRKDNKK